MLIEQFGPDAGSCNEQRQPLAIIWDFNGTILDDFALCLDTINQMLARRRLPILSADDYRAVFDFPVQNYYRQVGFDFDREPFPDLAAEYMAIYQPASLYCPLRRNISDTLADLRHRGMRQVMLSATKRDFLLQQTDHFGLTGFFDEIIGLDDILGRSKMDHARDWFGRQPFDPAATCLIGDTTHDYAVACALRCDCLLLSGGHNSRERLAATGACVLDDLAELGRIFRPAGQNGM